MTEPMSKVDNFWLCMDDPTNLMMISGFMEFDEPLEIERLRATLEHRLLCFKRFRQRVVRPMSGVGVPNWEVDPHFDIRSHLQRVALPEPGDKKTLKEILGNLMTTPLDDTKPLWQAHLVENYYGGCVVFFRIHHCIADGIALIYVLLSMTDTEPHAPWPEGERKKKREERGLAALLPFKNMIDNVRGAVDSSQKMGKRIMREMLDAVSNPVHMIEMARLGAGLAVDAASVLAKLSLMPPHPHNSFRGNLGIRKCAAWTDPMPLGNIKNVGRAVEATLNDVLIATITGALRRYLATRNDKVNELDLQVTVPVNIRKPGTEFELGNKFSLVWLALPVHIEDPILRLREVKRRMDRLKHSPDAFVVFSVLNALGMSPPKIAARAAQLFANKSTGVLTNVPGPRQPLYYSGERIKNMMFWVPRAGRVGLGISIFSYNGKVSVGLASDERLVPDPEAILEGFEDDFNQLLDLINSGKLNEEPLVLHDRFEESKTDEIEAGFSGDDSGPDSNCEPETETENENENENGAPAKPAKCSAITKSGRQCRNLALTESAFCSVHQQMKNEAG